MSTTHTEVKITGESLDGRVKFEGSIPMTIDNPDTPTAPPPGTPSHPIAEPPPVATPAKK